MNKMLILFLILTCFTGQALATTFSCKKSEQFNTQSSSKMNCHDEAMSEKHAPISDAESDLATPSNDCEDKCSCCISLCASTSLFLVTFTINKPFDTVIPFYEQSRITSQITSHYRPPIVA